MSVFEKQNFSMLLIWKLNTKIQYHPHPFLSWISPHSSYSPHPPSTILDSSECLQNENCLHSLQGAEQNKIVSFIIYIFKIGLIDCNFKLRVHPTVVIVASLVRWLVFQCFVQSPAAAAEDGFRSLPCFAAVRLDHWQSAKIFCHSLSLARTSADALISFTSSSFTSSIRLHFPLISSPKPDPPLIEWVRPLTPLQFAVAITIAVCLFARPVYYLNVQCAHFGKEMARRGQWVWTNNAKPTPSQKFFINVFWQRRRAAELIHFLSHSPSSRKCICLFDLMSLNNEYLISDTHFEDFLKIWWNIFIPDSCSKRTT